ncbi:baseplate J/gp47 family protein [Levilactobacillus lindianensis]|uniref:baseplate J/gp47 family protein n=1 Tax=Levilactobacillus lindianensis TaxID=2486018 RepID=UPI000F741AA2|nr:baseplate J/gp47 family protein [Levilactobacillus lindianensis]
MALTDENGYDLQELDDLREEINQDAKEKLGDNVATDDAHHLGQLLGGLSLGRKKVEDFGELVYNAWSILRGRNSDLDIIGSDFGVSRKPATPATTYLQIDANVGTVIPEGTQFGTADEVLFDVIEEAKVPEIATVKDDNGQDVPLTDDDGNEIGRIVVQAQADQNGISGNVGAGTITDQSGESIDGVIRVTNPEAASGGDEIESEINYRDRAFENRLARSDSTEDGLKTNVENVAGVLQCKVQVNNELTEDSFGNPAKTSHFYVIGGADQDIAEAIFHAIGAPGHTVGEVSKTVLNHSGQKRTVNFSRAKLQAVYVQVHIKTTDSFDSDNGIANLKDKVIEYDRTLSMGDSLLYSKLFEYLWQVDGISSIDLTVGTDKASLSLGNVAVDLYSLAYITADNIEVIIDD